MVPDFGEKFDGKIIRGVAVLPDFNVVRVGLGEDTKKSIRKAILAYEIAISVPAASSWPC